MKINYTNAKCKSLLKHFVIIIFLVAICVGELNAQVYLHDFGTTSITTHPYTIAPSTFDANLSNSSWNSSTTSWTSFVGSGGQAISLSNSNGTPIITLTFAVNPGYELKIDSYSFWRQRSAAGAQNWSMTINNMATGSGTVPTTGTTTGTIATGLPISNLTGTVIIVLSLSGATGNGTFRLDDFRLNGIATALAGTSTLTAGPLTQPITISSLANTSAAAVQNFDFTLTDDGTIPATNTTITRVSQIVFNQGIGNDIADWTQAIAGAQLTDGTSILPGTISATGITFASLANTNPTDFGFIADNQAKTYTLKVWLRTSLGGGLATSIDGSNLVFEVSTSSIILVISGSNFAAGENENSGASNNAVNVLATKYIFRTLATNVAANNNFSVIIDATDANNNRDLNNTDAITLVKNTGMGSFTVTTPQNLLAGTRSFTDCQFDAAGTYTLNAAGTFTTITSANIIATIDALGDYRSKNTGIWSNATNWERFDGTNWLTASAWPSSSDGAITILSGHIITIDDNVSIDQVIIASGAILARTTATITLDDGIGDDMIINGTWKENFSSGNRPSGNGTFLVNHGGIIEINRNPSGGETDYYANNKDVTFASRVIWKTGSIFYWNTSAFFNSAQVTYFPNVPVSEIPIFRINCNCVFGGGVSNPTIINGIFEVQSGASPILQFPGTKIFRNGIRGAGQLRQDSDSGPFMINGNVSELSIAGLNLNNAGLIINHTGTTALRSNIIVSGGKISLTAGDINLNGFNIDLGTSASIQENLINNHLIQDNTATFDFNPGGYIRATNRNVTATPTDIAGLGMVLSDATAYSLTTIDRYHYRSGIRRMYRVLGAPTATTLRINYASDELAGITESELTMFRWRSATGWVNYTTGITKDASAKFVQVTDVNGFSNWTLNGNFQPLPIQLISFNAKKYDSQTAKLTWQTASEQNNIGFEIEKSTDGKVFAKIGFLDGSINSSSIKTYQFLDKNFSQSGYYRLKQIDQNATFVYSNLVFVNQQSLEGLSIYPNPVVQSIRILHSQDQQTQVNLQLYSTEGKQLFAKNASLGQVEAELNNIVPKLAKGLYMLKLISGHKSYAIKMVKD